jgi:hypothetical protein
VKFNIVLFITIFITLLYNSYAQSGLTEYTIHVKSHGIEKDLILGTNPYASDGIDTALGEYNLPPYVSGEFDARFRLYDTTLSTYKDLRYCCGWASGGSFFLEWKNGDNVSLTGGILFNSNIYSMVIKNPYTGENLATYLEWNDSLNFNVPIGLDHLVLYITFNGTLSWGSIKFNSIKSGQLIQAGSNINLTWNLSLGAPDYTTDILLSTNDGETWNYIAKNIPTSQSSYSWTVPDISSNQCRLRIGDYPCLYNEVGTFYIYQNDLPLLYPVYVPFALKNGNNEIVNLITGLHPNATDGLDTALGEVAYNFQPQGNFDAAFAFFPPPDKFSRKNIQLGNQFVYGKRSFFFQIQPGKDTTAIFEADLPQGITAELEYNKEMPYGTIPEKKDLGAGHIEYQLPKSSLTYKYNEFKLTLFFNTTVPVELILFNANADNFNVALNWITATETNNAGFEIQKSNIINQNFQEIGFVKGNGTTTEKNQYSFIDKNLKPGKYYYRLKQIDYDGSFKYSKEVEVSIESPKEFALKQNYPNPFNPTTKIKYKIPQTGSPLLGGARGGLTIVQLKIYDILGREVATLVNEKKSPGKYEVEFDAGEYNLPSGIYFYQLKAGSFIQTKKLVLMK